MTENNNGAEKFIVGEWVGLYDGKKLNRRVEVLAVHGDEVTVSMTNKPVKFAPRPSDGKMVKVGAKLKNASTIAHIPAKTSLKDKLSFLFGAFLGS